MITPPLAATIVRNTGVRWALFGHSMGAAVARETYQPASVQALDVPLTVLRATSDPEVDEHEARAWTRATTETFEVVEFPGDHLYLVDAAAEVTQLAADRLQA